MWSVIFQRAKFTAMMLLFPVSALALDLKIITLEVAPWAFYNDEERVLVSGIFPDLVRDIEQRTGYDIKVTLSAFGFDRIFRELNSGRQDCTVIIKNNDYDAILVQEAFYDHPMGVVAHKKVSLKHESDLYGLQVSVHQVLAELAGFVDDPRIGKDIDMNYELGLKKIEHGRVDGVVGAIPTIQYLAKQSGVDHLLGKPLVLKKEPIYLQCSKYSKNLSHVENVNKAIRAMKTDGTIDRIKKHYR